MILIRSKALAAAFTLVGLVGCSHRAATIEGQNTLLVFTKTAGYRHDSIPDAVQALKRLAKENGFTVECTEDAGAFEDSNLARFHAVIFLNTSGDVLDEQQQTSFQRFFRQGGGFIGVHAAADTEHDWEFYGTMLGARFLRHPDIQAATIVVIDHDHPSTRHLPKQWIRTDEWYDFSQMPSGSRILACVDEASYQGGTMGEDHPIAWCHERQGARVWYTSLGHTRESYTEPEFLKHLLGGIQWAARMRPK